MRKCFIQKLRRESKHNNFLPENLTVNEIHPEYVVGDRHRPQMKIWSMRIACWTQTIKNVHSEYVVGDRHRPQMTI